MQSQRSVPNSCPSSATFSLTDPRFCIPERQLDDDLAITQGLLEGSKKLAKRTSFNEGHLSLLSYDDSMILEDSFEGSNAAPLLQGRSRRGYGTSNTWTSSSGEMISEHDEIDDRSAFIQEYNRLAKKHGVRCMVVDDFPSDALDPYGKAGSWFSRKILRRTSSSQSITKSKTDRSLRHKRSISDLSLRLKSNKNKLKDKDLQELVRLCGSSLLYLPSEYATGSLAVPTCFRATAQYLVQHAPTTRGVFRISGSHGSVALLYNHFCAVDERGEVISGTVRCPTLPEHIPCDVHDVASAFKKFISGLPGGILGSLRLFDALISIQTQLNSDPELTRTKQSKVRARLIALAIFTLKSQYRRELICAVCGLLCMIGRAAETSKREDDRGRPLPTSDLMGYGPLGIVFGPLLVGDLLESYTMRLANPHGGLILLPISPPKSRKERQKEKQKQKKNEFENTTKSFNTFVDKVKIANGVTEMLITHWREVVCHMKNLKKTKTLASHKSLAVIGSARPVLRPSASDTFAIRKPPNWDGIGSTSSQNEEIASPTPTGRTGALVLGQSSVEMNAQNSDGLNVRKQRLTSRPISRQFLAATRSLSILTPTTEEVSREDSEEARNPSQSQDAATRAKRKENEHSSVSSRHSKLSRKDDSSNTPSKLRKSRPAQSKKDAQNLMPSDQNKEVNDTAYSKSSKGSNGPTSSHQVETKLSFNNNNQGLTSNQKYTSRLFKPDLLKSKTWLLRADAAVTQSKDARIPEGLVSRQIRRITASEPSKNPTILGFRRRLVSKSLQVDSTGRVNTLNGNPGSRDPLSLVSKEEDLASLRALAQVIKLENATLSPKELDVGLQDDKSSGPPPRSPRRDALDSRYPEVKTGPAESSSITESAQSKSQNKTSSLYEHPSGRTENSPRGSPSRGSLPLITTPKHVKASHSPIKRFNSPAHSVKALAAKFNTAESTHVFESPTKLSPRKTSPIQPRRENLVGTYTTNTPSPKRSQKSAISEKSPFLTRKPLGELRLTPRSISVSPTKKPKDSTSKVTALQTWNRAVADKVSGPTAGYVEIIARTLDGHASVQNDVKITSDSPLWVNKSDSIHPKALGHSVAVTDINKNTRQLELASSTHAISPTSDLKKSPIEGHDKGPTIRSDRSVSDELAPSVNQSGTHLVHSNSVLYGRVRDLRRQLAVKSEAIIHLRQQLDARSNLDIGTLSEQLRDAKKEALAWKLRAEISEKQVEMLTKRTVSRSVSMKRHSQKLLETATNYNEDEINKVRNMRRNWQDTGMDGAGSNDTTGTVIRETKEAPTGSEYSIWVQQTLEELGAHEME